MSDVPYYFAIVQGVITAIIAIGLGVIAYFQWRTAHNKFVLDLFDRRFQLFMDVREVASKGGSRNELSDPGLPNELIARGRFLFGPDILTDLEEVHTLCVKIETGDPHAHTQLHKKFTAMLPKFESHMRMGQKIR